MASPAAQLSERNPNSLDDEWVAWARSQFPSLSSNNEKFIYADNAAGSQECPTIIYEGVFNLRLPPQQVLGSVINATSYYFRNSVYPATAYPKAQAVADRIDLGARAAALLFNADPDEIGFGPTTTQLLANLAKSMAPTITKDDHIVMTVEHEANVGPWANLVKSFNPPLEHFIWKPEPLIGNPNPYAVGYSIETLLGQLRKETRIVAICGSSNILAEEYNIAERVKQIRAKVIEKGGRDPWVVLDLVGYAPHRSMDVKKWNVDFAVFSLYKVYGPHTAALYVSKAQLPKLTNINHYFLPDNDSMLKLLPGGPGYELTYSASFVLSYLVRLSNHSLPDDPNELLKKLSREELRALLENTSELIQKHEIDLTRGLLAFLKSPAAFNRGVRIVGMDDGATRTPTLCFVVVDTATAQGMKSEDLVKKVNASNNIGIRWGHYYAYRLIASLWDFSTVSPTPPGKRSVNDGVVRISLVHYNTLEEVDQIVQDLKKALSL